jgi:hypothetical protein
VRRPWLTAVLLFLGLLFLAAISPRHLRTSWWVTAVAFVEIAYAPPLTWYFRHKLTQNREQAEVTKENRVMVETIAFSLALSPSLIGSFQSRPEPPGGPSG